MIVNYNNSEVTNYRAITLSYAQYYNNHGNLAQKQILFIT